MNKKTATALVIAAGVFWGIISLFINRLTELGFESPEIAFLRVLECALIVLCYLLVKDRKLLKIRLKDVWIFAGTGIVSLTFFNVCYFLTMTNLGASVAVSLLYTSPVFVMLFSAVLFREKITFQKVLAIVCTVFGVVLISGILGSGAKIGFSALLIGICAGLFYALYSIFGRYGTDRYHPFTVTFYTFVFATFGSLFIVSPSRIVEKIAAAPVSIPVSILSAILCGVLPYVFYTLGLTALDTTVAGVLVAVEPLVGAIMGIAVFREDAQFFKLLGIALILSSIVILSLPSKKEKHGKTEKNKEA